MTNKSLQEIQKEIQDLQKQEKQMIEKARVDALVRCKSLVSEFEFTSTELGIRSKSAVISKPKYADPKNPTETWTGKGKQPNWYKTLLAAGKNPDDLLIRK